MRITKWKKANLKRLRTLSFQLYDILEKGKLWRQYKVHYCQGLGKNDNEWVEHRGLLEQWYYSVWYYIGRQMSTIINLLHLIECPRVNPELWTLDNSDVSV